MLRILVVVNGMALAGAVLKSPSYQAVGRELMGMAVLVQPVLLMSLILLCAGNRLWRRLSYAGGIGVILVLELAVTTLVFALSRDLLESERHFPLPRYWLFTLLASAVLLTYFNLRSRALSPALSEARLQALQARIRPHFLFNSINAVLSLIRSDPRRAESALEDLADLFRVLMADNLDLVPIEKEVGLCRQYLDLEQLRLGERLKVAWHIEKMPRDALVPPLVLQPLLENAVYHGIEPSTEPGEVCINIYRSRQRLHMVLRNPYRKEGGHHAGNKMAVGNIRERLALHFDAEGSLAVQVRDNQYQVHIEIPYVTERP